MQFDLCLALQHKQSEACYTIHLLSNSQLASTMHVKRMYIKQYHNIIEWHQNTTNISKTYGFQIMDSSERLLWSQHCYSLLPFEASLTLGVLFHGNKNPVGWELKGWNPQNEGKQSVEIYNKQHYFGVILVFGPILSVWYNDIMMNTVCLHIPVLIRILWPKFLFLLKSCNVDVSSCRTQVGYV